MSSFAAEGPKQNFVRYQVSFKMTEIPPSRENAW